MRPELQFPQSKEAFVRRFNLTYRPVEAGLTGLSMLVPGGVLLLGLVQARDAILDMRRETPDKDGVHRAGWVKTIWDVSGFAVPAVVSFFNPLAAAGLVLANRSIRTVYEQRRMEARGELTIKED